MRVTATRVVLAFIVGSGTAAWLFAKPTIVEPPRIAASDPPPAAKPNAPPASDDALDSAVAALDVPAPQLPPSTGLTESTSSAGLREYTMPVPSFEACVAGKATSLAKLNVSPRRLIEIINTNLITVTRVCLDDGQSLLITCSRDSDTMLMTLSPHTTDVGCPP